MVFSNNKMKSDHHNRLNLRDVSAEPQNLFGDRNLPNTEDTNEELNDRFIPDDLPDLEEAHVPHAVRKERAASKASEQKARRPGSKVNSRTNLQ